PTWSRSWVLVSRSTSATHAVAETAQNRTVATRFMFPPRRRTLLRRSNHDQLSIFVHCDIRAKRPDEKLILSDEHSRARRSLLRQLRALVPARRGSAVGASTPRRHPRRGVRSRPRIDGSGPKRPPNCSAVSSAGAVRTRRRPCLEITAGVREARSRAR